MSKTKKAPAATPAPVYTPRSERLAVIHRLTITLPAYLKQYADTVEKFQADVQQNPRHALEWGAERAMLALGVQDALAGMGFANVADRLAELTAEEEAEISGYARRLTDDLLRGGEYLGRCTSEMTNLISRHDWHAKQIVCAMLRWLEWELAYLHRIDAQVDAATITPERNPTRLI
jgi:hypothetical protein